MWNIEYQNDNILIMSDCNGELFIIMEKENLKNVKINTWLNGLTNKDVEKALNEVLSGGWYDIKEEIENYRTSHLWYILKENEE